MVANQNIRVFINRGLLFRKAAGLKHGEKAVSVIRQALFCVQNSSAPSVFICVCSQWK